MAYSYSLIVHYVYIVENLINGKLYVGKSVLSSKRHRWTEHLWIARQDPTKYRRSFTSVDYAIKKYGERNFVFTIIRLYESALEALLEENYWINYLISQNTKIYNIDHELGVDLTTEQLERKKKLLSDKFAGEKNPFFGKEHTREIRTHLSIVRSGTQSGKDNNMFGKTHSLDAKNKISKTKTGVPNPSAIGNYNSSKLTPEHVIEIRKLIILGKSCKEICKLFSISSSTFYAIKNNKSWKTLGDKNE